jgi:hypothetical protein
VKSRRDWKWACRFFHFIIWNDDLPDLDAYNASIPKILISKLRLGEKKGRDFGPGFYVTVLLAQKRFQDVPVRHDPARRVNQKTRPQKMEGDVSIANSHYRRAYGLECSLKIKAHALYA